MCVCLEEITCNLLLLRASTLSSLLLLLLLLPPEILASLPSAASRLIRQLQPPVCFVCSQNCKKETDSEKFTSNRLLCLSLLRASFRASLPPLFAPLKLPPLFPPCFPRCRLPPRPFADDRLNLFNNNI